MTKLILCLHKVSIICNSLLCKCADDTIVWFRATLRTANSYYSHWGVGNNEPKRAHLCPHLFPAHDYRQAKCGGTINDDTHGGLLVWQWVEKLPPAATETWRQVPVSACPLSDNPRYKKKQKHPFFSFSLTRTMICFALDAFNYLFLEDGIFFIVFFKPNQVHEGTRGTDSLSSSGCLIYINCLKGGAVNWM